MMSSLCLFSDRPYVKTKGREYFDILYVNNILWILLQLVIQLSPSADRKEYYLKQLNKGPALILFLPLKLYMDKVNQHILEVVSRIYTSPAEKGWHHQFHIAISLAGMLGESCFSLYRPSAVR